MPSERKTDPTAIRIRLTAAGAVVVISLRSDLMELTFGNLLHLWWRGRCKLRDICEPQTGLDRGDLFYGIFKTVFTKLLVLDVLKRFVHFVELSASIPEWSSLSLIAPPASNYSIGCRQRRTT